MGTVAGSSFWNGELTLEWPNALGKNVIYLGFKLLNWD